MSSLSYNRVGAKAPTSAISRLTKPLNIMFLCLGVPLFGCAVPDRVDNRNFAVDTYNPTANEIQLAQHYWQNNSQRFQNPPRYLAVDTTGVLQGDVIQNLYPEMINSETTASFFG